MSSCDRAPLVTDNSLFPRSAKTSLPIVAAPVNPCNSTRGAARLWLGVHVHARIIMQHIQVWKKKHPKNKKKHVVLFKPTIQYFPDGTGPHGLAEFLLSLFHMLSYKVTRWSKCSCRVVCLFFPHQGHEGASETQRISTPSATTSVGNSLSCQPDHGSAALP